MADTGNKIKNKNELDKQIWTSQERGQLGYMGRELKKKKGRIEPERAGSCEEVQFVLVKLAAIWSASELVLEVIFIVAFIAWRACAAPTRECLSTCQCTTIQLMGRNEQE